MSVVSLPPLAPRRAGTMPAGVEGSGGLSCGGSGADGRCERHANLLYVPARRARAGRNSSSDLALLALFQAIAEGDIRKVSSILVQDRFLASAALETGASRGDAKSYYYESIAHYAYAGDTALHLASAAYLSMVVCQLLDCGASVLAGNRRGAQPLHYACDGGPTAGRDGEQAQADVIRTLISRGADPNAVDKSGVAPIHRAVRCRSAGAVEALLSLGADPRSRNHSGSTPLHLAVQDTGRGGSGRPESRQAQAQIIGILLAHGARLDDRDGHGKKVSDIYRPSKLST